MPKEGNSGDHALRSKENGLLKKLAKSQQALAPDVDRLLEGPVCDSIRNRFPGITDEEIREASCDLL